MGKPMLEKPALPDEKITACLQAEFGLAAARLAFLPLGADRNTAVYRAEAGDGTPYFVKLRSGPFEVMSVAVPRFLHDQGVAAIIPPLAARSGSLWGHLDEFRVILYPFVEGRDGYEVELSAAQWGEFGAALRKIHGLALPPDLAGSLPVEDYSDHWRGVVRTFLQQVETETFREPLAAQLAEFLRARRDEVRHLVQRAGGLAQALQARDLPLVLCHSDLHAGNLLITPGGRFYLVDWDNPILASKERDLMFVGGSQGFIGRTAEEEEALFYDGPGHVSGGYGRVAVDLAALAYYRYERIVQDIAVYCEQLFLSDEGGEDRANALGYLKSNFLPGGTIAAARRVDP